MKRIGLYLRECREKIGLTQGDVAKKMGWDNAQYVSNIERGISAPPKAGIKKMCELLSADKHQVVEMMVDSYKRMLKAKVR